MNNIDERQKEIREKGFSITPKRENGDESYTPTSRNFDFNKVKVGLKTLEDAIITGAGDLKKVNNPVVNYLNSIKGVNLKTSKLICGELKLNCLNDLLKISKDDLISIKGIGENKSELILKAIKGD